jgi:hypothetical protein
MNRYFAKVEEILLTVMQSQSDMLQQAADRCTDALFAD